MTKTVLTLGLLLLTFQVAAIEPIECRYILRSISNLKKELIQPNREMILSRDLNEYVKAMGPEFVSAIEKDGGHWIDVGAGNAVAQRQLLLGNRVKPGKGSRFTAIAVGTPSEPLYESDISRIQEKYGTDTFVPKWGKYLNEYKKEDFEKADLITDYFGALSYTEHLDTDTGFLLGLLRPGGKMILVMTVRDEFTTKVKTSEGEKEVTDFFKKVKGVTLKEEELFVSVRGHTERRIVLERTGEELQLPKLKLVNFLESGPPFRVYEYGPGFFRP